MSWTRWGIVVVLFVYVGLAVGYSLATPPFEAPDEIHHYAFIRDLIHDRVLPVQREGDRPSQRHQPPLYYLAGAAASFWSAEPEGAPYSVARSNPYWGYAYGEVGRDNKNLYLHGSWDRFPYTGTALGLHVVRLLSVLIGALSVYAAYRTGLEVAGTPAIANDAKPDGDEPSQGSIDVRGRTCLVYALALGGVAFMAFNPMFVFITGAVSNDGLLTLWVTLILWMLIRTVNAGITVRMSLVIGALCGLALLTKLTALYILPVVVAAYLIAAWSRRDWRKLIAGGALIAGLTLLIAGWWFARNLALYGDLTSINLTLRTWHARPEGVNWAMALFELPNAETSFWARFGYGNVPVPNWMYQLLGVVSRLGLIGAVGLAYGMFQSLCKRDLRAGGPRPVERRAARAWQAVALVLAVLAWGLLIYSFVIVPGLDRTGQYVLMGLSALAACFLLVRSPIGANGQAALSVPDQEPSLPLANLAVLALTAAAYFAAMFTYMSMSTTAANGRYMFPGLAGLSLLIFLGLAYYLPRRWTGGLAIACLASMAALSTLALFLYMIPAYSLPVVLPSESAEAAPRNLNIDFGGQARLLGSTVRPPRARPGDAVDVTLYWQALQDIKADHSVTVQVFGRDGQRIGQRDSFPGLGSYPTSEWRKGQVIVDGYQVPIDPEASAPVEATVDVGLYDLSTMDRLPALDAAGRKLGRTEAANFKLAPRKKPRYDWQQPADYTLGEQIALRGYDLGTAEMRAGETLPLTLYWEALSAPDRDYTVFIHVLDESGKVWAQQDAQPAQGSYPTSLWEKGEIVEDRHDIPLPADLPSGRYRVAMGLYSLQTMERLPVVDSQVRRLPDGQLILWQGDVIVP